MKAKKIVKATLLLTSMMTMMAGAVVAPSLPQINQVFSEVPSVDLLTRLVITLPALFIGLLSPSVGIAIDKIGRKKLLLFSLVVYAFSGTSGYYLNNLYAILAGRAVLGVSVAGIMTIATTLIGDYFQGEERSGFMGMQGAFMGFGGVVFIIVAGWLADVQWQLPFLIYAFSIPVLILAIAYLYEPKLVHDIEHKVNVPRLKYNKALVGIVLAVIFFGTVFFYMIPVQLPYLLMSIPDVTYSQVGYSLSIGTLSAAIVAVNYKSIKCRLSFPFLYFLTFSLMGLGFLGVSQSTSYLQVSFSQVVAGLGVGLMMPSGNLWIMELAPAAIRGRLMGMASMALFMGIFFSPVISQPIVNLFSIHQAFFIAAILMILISLAFLLFKQKLEADANT